MLYGSETGNAEALAGVFGNELKRRGIRPKVMAMDDFDFEDLPNQVFLFVIFNNWHKSSSLYSIFLCYN